MQIRTLAVAAALSFVSAGAFAQDVKVDFDKAADFTKYKTFAIKLGTSWNNPLGEKRVLAEIQQGTHREGLDGHHRRRQGRRDRRPPRRHREAEEPQHVLQRRLRRLRLARADGAEEWGPPPPPWTNTPSARWSWTSSIRSPSSSCIGDRHGRALEQAREERQEAGQGLGQAVQGLPARIGEEIAH
jgi:hypothetical protein